MSAQAAFRTQPLADTEPPIFVVAPRVVYAAGDRVVIEWQTDEPAEAVVEYGPTAERQLRVSPPGRRMQHQATLSNLLPNTQYFVRVVVTDAAGNVAAADLQ